MKHMKIQITIALLFIVVGLAAVTTNLIINVSTPIASNQDDFLVYFSNVKVDGTQDLSLVRNEKTLVFNSEFSAVGDKVTIAYDITNASKNYDATISISCTESNEYLNVTNTFDQKTNLSARSTRTGTLLVTLTKAVSLEQNYAIKCTITGTAVEKEIQSNGEIPTPLQKTIYAVGEEVSIGSERFNVIRDNGDTITMLAKYSLERIPEKPTRPGDTIEPSATWCMQGTENNLVSFSNSNGWEYTPGPKEIDIQAYDGEVKEYINEYVRYLKTLTNDSNLTGTLITLTELKELGCTINDYYYNPTDQIFASSKHKSWLHTGTFWWTRSASGNYSNKIWMVVGDGGLYDASYDTTGTIRPVITISKSVL